MNAVSIASRKAGYLCIIVGALALFSVPAQAKNRVSLALDWIVGGEHAGYFVAKAKGFYADAGLDVAISRGYGSGDTIKRVAAGASTFGVADTAAIIAARANEDVPVRIVGMAYDESALGVIYSVKSRIRSPKDLEGRSIGRSASGASVNMFPAFLAANGINRAKIKEVVVDATLLPPMLASGRVDAVLDQGIVFPQYQAVARQQGRKLGFMAYADYGLRTYGNAIITRPAMLSGHPDIIRRFLKATFRGMAYAFAHQKEAIAIVHRFNPEVDALPAMEELTALRKFALTPEVRKHGFGYISNEQMAKTEQITDKALHLTHTVPLDQLYTVAFLPKPPIFPVSEK